jgi:hypothetical protein
MVIKGWKGGILGWLCDAFIFQNVCVICADEGAGAGSFYHDAMTLEIPFGALGVLAMALRRMDR